MRRFVLLAFLLIASCTIEEPPAESKEASAAPSPPVAARVPVELEKHGDLRVDPYYWLRERENPDVIAYLEAENTYFAAQTKHQASLREVLFEEIKGRIKQDDSSVPYRLGDYEYYSRTEEGSQYRVHARRGSDGVEQVLVDVNSLAKDSGYYAVAMGARSYSPDGRYAVYATDTTGRRFYTLAFLDMATGEILSDRIANVTPAFAWADDNKTLFYVKQDPETLRWHQIFRHELGTEANDDVLVFEEPDPTFNCSIFRSSDRQYLLIGCRQTISAEVYYLAADDPTGAFASILPRERGHEYSADHHDGHWYLRTNRDARNFRVVRTPVGGDGAWEEVIPHRDDVFVVGTLLFEDYLVVGERANGLDRFRVQAWANPDGAYELPFDDAAYAVFPSNNVNYQTTEMRLSYQSLTTPPMVFDFDLASRARTILKETEVLGGFDSENYHIERIAASARDGAAVPVTLVYRKDRFSGDGSNPLLQLGYGSYGNSIAPGFRSSIVSLLDRGFVFAIAHIRGSQTLGRAWYDDGKLLAKKNTFNDFIDVTDHLVAKGYADPDRAYAMGGSAGGLLMGAVMNQRPDRYHGIIAHVPFVDVVTTMLDEDIPLTTAEFDEWGNPNEKTFYDYMLSYSPYDNVVATAYPNLLVTAGLHDSQVQYWEPAKWVAKLRSLKTNDARLYLDTNMAAGHGGSSGRFDSYRETARDWAFLLDLAEAETAGD